jgi:purine-cytosine permease-like protein
MVLKMKKNQSKIKKLSDYIMNFAFLYSSFLCFTAAIEKWDTQKILAIIIFICGSLSFIAVFRYQIAKIFYKIRNVKDHE